MAVSGIRLHLRSGDLYRGVFAVDLRIVLGGRPRWCDSACLQYAGFRALPAADLQPRHSVHPELDCALWFREFLSRREASRPRRIPRILHAAAACRRDIHDDIDFGLEPRREELFQYGNLSADSHPAASEPGV